MVVIPGKVPTHRLVLIPVDRSDIGDLWSTRQQGIEHAQIGQPPDLSVRP